MSTAAMALGWRPRPRLGPALRRARLPYRSLAVSAAVHAIFAAGVIAGAAAWRASQPRTYVVNLVPAVAAVGVPQGKPTPAPAPSLPPRPVEPPRPARPEPERALPERSLPELPAPARAREAPALPEPSVPRARESVGLPDRPLPPRPAALPRPGDKELPALASAPTVRPAPARAPAPGPSAPPRREPPPAPPPPLGRPTGSPAGAGTLTLEVGDFPFAWYLRQVQAKIEQTWQAPPGTREGQEVVAVFEILRDGQTRRLTIERSSGDPVYDQAALRAITEASPFPPLPADFKEPPLRIHLGFTYRGRG